MKVPIRFATLSALALVLTASFASAAPKTFTIDRSHSEVGFNVRHFFSKVHGRFENYSGTIVYDEANLVASTVEVTIADTSINTQTERRDNHLRSEDFFWTEKHPTLTFKSTKVVPGKDKTHFSVLGDLTMRGVTKPVTLAVEFLGSGDVSVGGSSMGTRAGFIATTTVNRKDYGISWNKVLDSGGAMLGEDVEIVLNIEAVEKVAAK